MPNQHENSVSRGELLDVSSDVAWRFKAYGAYGANRETAIRSIRRKCTGFSKQQYDNALNKSLELYDAVHKLVQEKAAQLWTAFQSGDDCWQHLLDDELSQQFSAFRISTIRGMVGMMFYYWHMR